MHARGVSRELTRLSDGSHTVEVRATDMVGNAKVVIGNFAVNTASWLLPVVALGGLVIVAEVVVFLLRSRGRK